MGLNHYVAHINRKETSLHGTGMESLGKHRDLTIPFDTLYKLVRDYVQVVRCGRICVARYIGPNCLRNTVNGNLHQAKEYN